MADYVVLMDSDLEAILLALLLIPYNLVMSFRGGINLLQVKDYLSGSFVPDDVGASRYSICYPSCSSGTSCLGLIYA